MIRGIATIAATQPKQNSPTDRFSIKTTAARLKNKVAVSLGNEFVRSHGVRGSQVSRGIAKSRIGRM